jgi:hypothetical protein
VARGISRGADREPGGRGRRDGPGRDLPWPAPERVARWWADNKVRFVAGQRYLGGRPIANEHCRSRLRTLVEYDIPLSNTIFLLCGT